MDFNRLLHNHQIALMKAANPDSVDGRRNHVAAVNDSWKLIETAREKIGVAPFSTFPNLQMAPETGLNKG